MAFKTHKKEFSMDHGLRTPRKSLFLKSRTFGLGQTFWAKIFEAFGLFRLDYQHPFWYCDLLIHVFHFSTIIFTKKNKPFLYPTPKFSFGSEI
jgi:hypothetical protein